MASDRSASATSWRAVSLAPGRLSSGPTPTLNGQYAQKSLNEAQLDQQKAALAGLDIQEKQIQAQVEAAEAQVVLATNNLNYTRIVSPADGMVGQRQVRPGQFVNVGTQLITVVPLPNVWVIANFKETQMTNVRVGQAVRVTVDAFPDVTLEGRVETWSPGTGSIFALLPPDNATGNASRRLSSVSPSKSYSKKTRRSAASCQTGNVSGGNLQHGSAGEPRLRPGCAMTSHTPLIPAIMRALHAIRSESQRLSIDSWRPYVGIVGVLLGAIMSTLGTRVSTLGLADLRGGLHVGFDEGAWITTSFGVGQMLVGVCCPYLGGILGVRRVLLISIVVLFTSSLLAPMSPRS